MAGSLRGVAAIVGIGELKPERQRRGQDAMSLLSEACYLAIQDAGLTKRDIDGMVMEPELAVGGGGFNPKMAEHMGIFPRWATSSDTQGAAGVCMALQAAAYIQAGLASIVLCGIGAAIDPDAPRRRGGGDATETATTEFQNPFGPTVGANGWYALIAQRHEHLYGTTVDKRAKVSVDFRYNANHNPMAIFHDTPLTVEEVVNSRVIADPLHLLECVMPCAGACAYVVARADIARSLRRQPTYILGGGLGIPRNNLTHVGEITLAPAGLAARDAFRMSGYGPRDIQVREIYDSFTITVICEMEDAGFCQKGEWVEWSKDQDFTFKGNFPTNTHGGNLSAGQASTAGGCAQVTEAVRQIRRDGGDHQVPGPTDIVMVTGSGGTFAQQSTMILGSEAAL
ncbi:MAG: thiolase family protein [Dehalococcoidia bacterium]|nr:thiolase family protein [Dehalococcoidia bacterium]